MYVSLNDVSVIAPSFKKRASGVTSSVQQLVPLQKKLGLPIAALGLGLNTSIPQLNGWSLLQLLSKKQKHKARLWHARRNIEMVVGILFRDVLGVDLRLIFTAAAERPRTKLTHSLLRKMDHIVAVTPQCASYINHACSIIPHGIDIEKFSPALPKASQSEGVNSPLEGGSFATAPYQSNQYMLGCFGRIRPKKGTHILIDVLLDLLPHYPNWSAIFLGYTAPKHQQYKANLVKKIAAAGLTERITFIGESKTMVEWYRRIAVYVSPSLSEGFGLTLLEAMACGKPIIASDVGIARQLAKANAVGHIVAPGHTASLKKALEFFLSHPEQAEIYGQNARDFVCRHYSLTQEARALIELYHKLLLAPKHRRKNDKQGR